MSMKNINTVIGAIDEVELTKSFMDACSNNDFKDFAYSLKTGEDILKKYTSSLMDCYLENKNCKNCTSLEKCKNKVAGYKYSPTATNDIITFSYVACSKKEDELKRSAYKDNLELFDMPKDILESSLSDLYTDDKARLPIIKYFKKFMDSYNAKENPKGIYLTGSFGSGKTYLIAALFNELAKKNIKGVLIYYPEFLRSLKASFNTNYNDKFDYIKKAPLLLLDDIGAENCSNWSRDEILGPILQYRMESHLPTFFTSNLSLEDLETSLAITKSNADKVKARRIIERIKQLTVQIELVSKNRRN